MKQKGFISWIILGVIVALTVFVYMQSLSSLPGSLLYPVKTLKETIYLAKNDLNFESKFHANIELSNERVREIVALVEKRGKEQVIRETLERLSANQKNALGFALRIKDRGSFIADFLDKLENTLLKHQEILSGLYYNISHELYDDLDQELLTTKEILKKVRLNRGPSYK